MTDSTMNEQEDRRLSQEAAEAGAGFREIPDDLPPPDQFQAARDLAALIGEQELTQKLDEIGLPSADPSGWESLDIARAASYARDHYPAGFERILLAHPWLSESAASASHDALGALADQF
jgi:hypothetical protein